MNPLHTDHNSCATPLDNAVLIGLITRELQLLPKWKAHRHLRHCEACRAELASLITFRAQMQTSLISPTSVFRGEVLSILERETAIVSPSVLDRPKRPLPLRIHRLALGLTTITAFGLALFLFVPGFPGAPSPSFAQVEKAMTEIPTAGWRSTYFNSPILSWDGSIRSSEKPIVRTYWVRMNPPTLATVWESSKQEPNRHVALPEETYQVITDTSGRNYSHYNFGIPTPAIWQGKGQPSPQDRLRAAILFSQGEIEQATQWKTQDGVVMERSAWKSTKTQLGGRPTLRFEAELKYDRQLVGPNEKGDSWKETGQGWTFWVEPETYRIVRSEVRKRYAGFNKTHEMIEVRDQFRYDTPPVGVFDYLPPAGIHYSFVPLPERLATDIEQTQIEGTIRKALNAWSRGNATAYSKLWDFDYEVQSEAKKQALRRKQLNYLSSGIPFRKWQIRQIYPAKTRISSNFVRRSSDPFPPKQSREFSVVVRVEGTGAQGQKREDFLSLNLRQDRDGFRLIRNYLAFNILRMPRSR